MTADRFRFDGQKPCELSDLPTGAGDAREEKAKYQERTAHTLEEMSRLQNGFRADGREGLVIVLQALDAAGKDSIVKHVMGGLNPQGVTVHSFKQPSAEELSHDFLWRANQALPPRGGIAIFNRSYYEDVLAVQVHDLQTTYRMPPRTTEMGKAEFFRRRYRQIRDYERYLYENGYRVLKLFLNVSKEKQKERFLERIEIPAKNWKFSASTGCGYIHSVPEENSMAATLICASGLSFDKSEMMGNTSFTATFTLSILSPAMLPEVSTIKNSTITRRGTPSNSSKAPIYL